ncbi:MAG TPA: pyrroline-5-carboxylate reductase [Bryobacteraceae bacterium]|nr:pyrroline-5-carboxylate reductase [Bryobacteraceae bacterium]
MKLGFLGTGTISSAMVTGLHATGTAEYEVIVSPRNATVAEHLKRSFPQVSVASNNQEVVDQSSIVVIAVRPQVVDRVLAELRFRDDHNVISLVSGLSVKRLAALVSPATTISRAVPLPSTARRRCPTPIYPGDTESAKIFGLLGKAIVVETEGQFDALCTATATMAAYFGYAEGIASWLTDHGIPPCQAQNYITSIFAGLSATAMESPEKSFRAMSAEHATPGGTNEQVMAYLSQHGVFDRLSEALDGVMKRVTSAR